MSSFPQFPLLPNELQLLIWYFALEAQEGNIVPIRHLQYDSPQKFKPHALFFVNCDSRRTYLESHKENWARHPRLRTMVFDPRIDIVLLGVGSFDSTSTTLLQIRNSPAANIMKDVRNVCIRTYYEIDSIHGAIGQFNLAFGHMIAWILPSLETLIYDPGSEPRYPERGSSSGGHHGNCYQYLSSPFQIDIARRRAYFQECFFQQICENLKQCKRSGLNPMWNIPRVLSTLDIHGEKVDVQTILRQRQRSKFLSRLNSKSGY